MACRSFSQPVKDIFPALHPFSGLWVKQGSYGHNTLKKKQENIVENDSQQIDFISPVPDRQK
jgi:hypothetical protein